MTRAWYPNERTVSAYGHARSVTRASEGDEGISSSGERRVARQSLSFLPWNIYPYLADNFAPPPLLLVPFRKVIYLRD